MEGEGRKRKLKSEEENEEQMEKFFALIKRTKDVRHRFNKEKTDKKIDGEKEGSVWKPMFQPEDFIDHVEMGKSDDHASPSEKDLIEKKQVLQEATTSTPPAPDSNEEIDKTSEILDLNLSL